MKEKVAVPTKDVMDAIKVIQGSLQEGDVITIWEDQFQIKLEGSAPANYVSEE